MNKSTEGVKMTEEQRKTEILQKIMELTAKIRKHKYVDTGVSINKSSSSIFMGNILRCSKCGRTRVLLSDDDLKVAMKERGCDGRNKEMK